VATAPGVLDAQSLPTWTLISTLRDDARQVDLIFRTEERLKTQLNLLHFRRFGGDYRLMEFTNEAGDVLAFVAQRFVNFKVIPSAPFVAPKAA
jgi:hypothetical protein